MTLTLPLAPSQIAVPGTGDSLIPVFVYGTLRIGQYNYKQWAEGGIRKFEQDCVANGAIYFVSRDGGYPVAKFDEPGIIKGDVLWFDRYSLEWGYVLEMEYGAGYTLVDIEARNQRGETFDCLGFDYVRKPAGPLIEGGDWIASYDKFE